MWAARSWFPALLVLAAVPSPAQSLPAPPPLWPNNPKAMLAIARQNYDFNNPALQPWHFKARYQLYDKTGQPSEKGTLEYWWASPKVYRATWIQGGSTMSEWHTADGKRLTVDSGDDIHALVAEVPLQLLDPVPETSAFRGKRLERKLVSLRNVQCPCVRAFDDLEPSGAQWFNSSMYCFDPKIPAVLLKDGRNGLEQQFGDVLTFQGHNLPRLLIETVQGMRYLVVSVDTVGAMDPNDPALQQPADAKADGIS